VAEVAEQPPAVTYVDDAGRERQHIFDFRFTQIAGTRWLLAVKPSALVAKSGIDRVVELVAEQIPPSVADFVVLFTEKKLSEVDLFNAEVVNMATRDAWPEDDAKLTNVIRKLKTVTIDDLVEKSGLGGYGYDAVVRAVDAGRLRLVEYRKLELDAVVTRASNRCPTVIVPADEVERFEATYISLIALARQQRRHHLAVKKELEAAGIKPALNPEKVGATFYRRKDLTGKLGR
jgi:hypothetical protein